ncbi:MAG: efflux RND transporter periplasmic adaptor subunit [Planctomycetes bacterium]|nr:efflux RND transporter periplasmic adaptor subunit [Planctomycetota bacterium]
MSEAPTGPPPPPRITSKAKVLLGVVCLVGVGLSTLGPRFPIGADAKGTDEGSYSGEGKRVEFATPRRGTLVTEVEAPGSVRAGSEVGIGAPFEGKVCELVLDTGDPVKKGQIVFRLDPTDRSEAVSTAELDQARNQAALGESAAERGANERRVEELKGRPNQLVEAQLLLRQKKLSLERAGASLEVAQLALKRSKGMLREGIGRELDVETAASERRQASIGVRLAEEELDLAKETLTFRKATWKRDQSSAAKDLEVALAREASAKANLKSVELVLEQRRRDLERCKIRSPIDGIVTARGVNHGDLVLRLTGTDTHYIVSDLRHLVVYCDVDEGDVIHVAAGQKARVSVNALGYGVLLEAAVIDVGYRAQTAQGEQVSTFTVRVLIKPDQDGLKSLRPGMSASATLETGRVEGALKIPLQALVQRRRKELPEDLELPPEFASKGPSDLVDGVFVIREGKARFQPILRGIKNDEEAQVLSGVDEKDQIVVGPFRVLKDLEHDTAVQAREAKQTLRPEPAPVTSATK